MEIPSQCPVCGAYSLTQDQQSSALLAVCDVLVLKALETMGKWIVRADKQSGVSGRARYREKGTKPWHVMHTLWQPDDATVDKALREAWLVVPAMLDSYGCCEITPRQITAMLDSYVHDLVITGTAHTTEQLRYRFVQLGLPVYDHA